MPKYLAQISGTAVKYSFRCNKAYSVDKDFRFEAEDEKLAKEQANQHLSELRRTLFEPNIHLESLLEIKVINVS